jgi:hypothetical protein
MSLELHERFTDPQAQPPDTSTPPRNLGIERSQRVVVVIVMIDRRYRFEHHHRSEFLADEHRSSTRSDARRATKNVIEPPTYEAWVSVGL